MTKKAKSNITNKQALERLLVGNERFVKSGMTHPNQTQQRRIELQEGQNPFAVILGCSDSRVPPEIIFDQGLGDLFVIRVAGNILSDIVLGSIEFAVQNFRARLIMVLGHSDCGAVRAAIAGATLEGHLSSIASAIQPAVNKVKNITGETTEHAVRANALNVAEQVRSAEPILSDCVQKGITTVVAAKYHFQTGMVEILQ